MVAVILITIATVAMLGMEVVPAGDVKVMVAGLELPLYV